MFCSRPLGEGVQQNEATFGQVHGSICGIVGLGSHVLSALWPGVELREPGNVEFCVPFSPDVFLKLQRLREPGTCELCVLFFTRGISLLT